MRMCATWNQLTMPAFMFIRIRTLSSTTRKSPRRCAITLLLWGLLWLQECLYLLSERRVSVTQFVHDRAGFLSDLSTCGSFALATFHNKSVLHKIGRASCRER